MVLITFFRKCEVLLNLKRSIDITYTIYMYTVLLCVCVYLTCITFLSDTVSTEHVMFAVLSKGFGTTGIVHEMIAEYTDVLSTVTFKTGPRRTGKSKANNL